MSYNCLDFLKEAIQSIRTFVSGDPEIIVVDNASVDGTVEWFPQTFPEIAFIANTKNVGFSAANNQGFLMSKGEYILLLNPDAKLIENNLLLAFDYLKNHPKTILGPKLLYPDFSLQQSVLPFPTFIDVLKEAFFFAYFFAPHLQYSLKTGKFALSGACLFMTREAYQSLNGLDEELFWMDDVDFCYRAKEAGFVIHYFTNWSVVHFIGQSSKKNYKVSISNQLISKLKFFKKNNQMLDYWLSVVFTQIHIVFRILLFLVLSPFKDIYRAKFYAYSYSQYLFFKYIFTSKKQTF